MTRAAHGATRPFTRPTWNDSKWSGIQPLGFHDLKAPLAADTLAAMTCGLRSDAEVAATRQPDLMVRRRAAVLALADVFLALTAVSLACVGFAAFMRRPTGAPGGGH